MNPLKANGKLLISAEYLVMHGARALAVPLRQGQSLLRIQSDNSQVFSWHAYYQDRVWFSAQFDPGNLKILSSSDPEKAEYLRKMLLACIELMPLFQKNLFKWDVETYLDFSPQWGFGSSSTLTVLLAEWAGINPLELHFMISEGSGYDVACASAEGPILYWLHEKRPYYQQVPFFPSFSDRIYFAWLGSKQNTAKHLRQLAGNFHPDDKTILQFNSLTNAMLEARDLLTFQDLMDEHEEALSSLLRIKRVSLTRFPGIPGAVKSLGAWGGDFVMIASESEEERLFHYLHKKEIQTIFKYQELVKDGRYLQKSTSD